MKIRSAAPTAIYLPEVLLKSTNTIFGLVLHIILNIPAGTNDKYCLVKPISQFF